MYAAAVFSFSLTAIIDLPTPLFLSLFIKKSVITKAPRHRK